MPDTDLDDLALDRETAIIRAIAGPADNPDFEARARAHTIGAIMGAQRMSRTDAAFAREVRFLLAAYTAATTP